MPITTKVSDARRDPTRLGRNFKKRLRDGDVLVGGTLLEYARPSLVKLYCQAGLDFLYVESEHVLFDPIEFGDLVLCARDNGLPVIAKTPQLERPSVCRLLDCGVTGIQLKEMLAMCKAHNVPFGTTASGIASAKRWIKGGARFFETADELSLILEGATKLATEYQAMIRGKR